MPNEYIDLGTIAWWNFAWQYSGTTYSTFKAAGTYLAHAVDIRDRFKTPMEAENGGNNWSVGRVAEMSNGNNISYGFVIKRLVGGVPSGHEWFIQVTAPFDTLTTPGWPTFYNVWGGGGFGQLPAHWNHFLKASAANLPVAFDDTNPNECAVAIHYHRGNTAAAAARAVLEFNGQPADTETVTIDGKAYQFQTVLTNSNGNVQIGASKEESVENLVAAINLDATTAVYGVTGPGTAYAAATTVHPTVTAISDWPGNTSSNRQLRIRAKTAGTGGNSIAIATNVANSDNFDGETTLLAGSTENTYGIGPGVDGDPPVNGYKDTRVYLFFPDEEVRPYVLGAYFDLAPAGGEANQFRWAACFNHEVPFILLLGAANNDLIPREIICIGDLIEPRDPGDIYKEATFAWYDNVTFRPSGGATGMDPGVTNANRQVHCLDIDGNKKVQWGLQHDDAFSTLNQPRSDDTWDLSAIRLYSISKDGASNFENERFSGIAKGYLRKDTIAHQGAYQASPGMVFESRYGRAVQFSYSFVYPWATDGPIPFYGWPTDPQDPVTEP